MYSGIIYTSRFSEFRYERRSPWWRIWRERFVLLAHYDLPIPTQLHPYIHNPARCEYLTIWRDAEGQWYARATRAYEWDGATLVPTTARVVKASLYHDLIYDYVHELAQQWGQPRRTVREFGDKLFRHILRQKRFRLRHLYYRGVRRLGGLWNEASLRLRPSRPPSSLH